MKLKILPGIDVATMCNAYIVLSYAVYACIVHMHAT